MTPLPVLKSSPVITSDGLIRLFHQSQLDWSRHLGDETQLDFGTWISNPSLPGSPAANCLLDAFLISGISAEQILGHRLANTPLWLACTLNPSMPGAQTQPLVDALLADGWISSRQEILHRTPRAFRSPIASEGAIADLKIIPARASYRHYEQLMSQRSEVAVAEAMLHLDDSHFDSLLALHAGQPVGSIGVLTSGETGTIREWVIVESMRQTSLAGILLDRALEICVRGMLRHVMIGLTESDPLSRAICQTAGFAPIGSQLTFCKDSCKSEGLFA